MRGNKKLAARKKYKIKLTAFGGVEAMGSAKRTVLFRVAQEALTNVARHAHATQVKLSITKSRAPSGWRSAITGNHSKLTRSSSAKTTSASAWVGARERVEMVAEA